MIVAAARNGVIGVDNGLPWRIPGDLRRFKELTLGGVVIMGRATHESIGRPLPNRVNVVMTRRLDYTADGVVIAIEIMRQNQWAFCDEALLYIVMKEFSQEGIIFRHGFTGTTATWRGQRILVCVSKRGRFVRNSSTTGDLRLVRVCANSTAELGRWLEITHDRQNVTRSGSPYFTSRSASRWKCE